MYVYGNGEGIGFGEDEGQMNSADEDEDEVEQFEREWDEFGEMFWMKGDEWFDAYLCNKTFDARGHDDSYGKHKPFYGKRKHFKIETAQLLPRVVSSCQRRYSWCQRRCNVSEVTRHFPVQVLPVAERQSQAAGSHAE